MSAFSHLHRLNRIVVLLLLGACANAAEAAIVSHSGTISAHTTWSTGDVHLVTGNITINAGVKLTIEAGAVVKFNAGRSITVNGDLDATGSSIAPMSSPDRS